MTEDSAGLDQDALRYERYWAPVLAGAGRALIDRVTASWEAPAGDASPGPPGPSGSRGSLRVLDVGAGTGNLLLQVASRWQDARIFGLDASAAMLSVARQRAGDDERFVWHAADAAAMPMGDGSVDVAVSAFMLQLVDDRPAVMREVRRVLEPGGIFGFVTWIADEVQMAADAEFDEAVYDLELDDPDADVREPEDGDFESIDQAEAELEAAGFESVAVMPERLSYAWTRADYLVFKETYDERELFESLRGADRVRLLARVQERWAALPKAAFTLEAPLVSAIARKR